MRISCSKWRPLPSLDNRTANCTQERNDQERVCAYSPLLVPVHFLATPETVPLNSPVSVKKTGLLEASATTGTAVLVKVRTPDASLKRPVPPVI